MVELTRTIRFATGSDPDAHQPEGPSNGFGGVPRMAGLGAYDEFDVTCIGDPDATTGYLINIKDIDVAFRAKAVPLVQHARRAETSRSPADLLAELIEPLSETLGATLARVRWRLSPSYSLEISMSDRNHAILRQQFDFAAAHRLHSDELSDEENRRIFGKCNNPSGHGHNYRVEPAVAIPCDGTSTFGLAELERLCIEHVINRFDHKHLNIDTQEFGENGVMPSVENIARVIHELLAGPIESRGGSLRQVTVWETDRTSCTYPAPPAG